MRPDDAVRLKALEKENTRPKRLALVSVSSTTTCQGRLRGEHGDHGAPGVLGQRSTQCQKVRTSAFEAELCSRIRAFAVTHPASATAAYTSGSCEMGSRSPAKRVQRLWRAEGLHVVPVRRRKPKVRGSNSDHILLAELVARSTLRRLMSPEVVSLGGSTK